MKGSRRLPVGLEPKLTRTGNSFSPLMVEVSLHPRRSEVQVKFDVFGTPLKYKNKESLISTDSDADFFLKEGGKER